MRRWPLAALLLVMFLSLATSLAASPGGLDSRGGHHCWTNCYYWGYYYGEYHCHRWPCDSSDIAYHRAHGH